ncbi:hypothetical protein [Ralstonia solanacearum]|uniref:hypothetical protein n=1 Tax=Ralstonia solanacearum TaxID=305 RepID=UPI001FFD3488|nr:hypothetical protein [Ralstonia solanacearum]
MPEAKEAAQLLYDEVVRLQSASADKAAELPAALAERFPSLAQAYEQAGDTRARILAILEHYPVCRLSHEQFPDGQPGLVRGSAELTMRNLFTVAIKVGTDSLKADTGTKLFFDVIEACLRSERTFRERLTSVPYSKETAYAMREARFDPEQAKAALQRNPNMAAGVMSLSVQALQRWGCWLRRHRRRHALRMRRHRMSARRYGCSPGMRAAWRRRSRRCCRASRTPPVRNWSGWAIG